MHGTSPQSHFCVKASAGTGKTHLLVTRILRLLLEGVTPASVLAITFTKKAAAEMHSRLIQQLYQWASWEDRALYTALMQLGIKDPNLEGINKAKNLYEQLLTNPSGVRIGTFHAFCQELLQRFPLEAAIDPSFEILDKTLLLEQEAWEALMTDATLNPQTQVAQALLGLFTVCGNLATTQDSLFLFLHHRSDWWAYTDQIADPLPHCLGALAKNLAISPQKKPSQGFGHPQHRQQLQQFAAILSRHATKTNEADAQAILQALELDSDEALVAALMPLFFTQQGKPRQAKASKESLKSLGDELQTQLMQLREYFVEQLLKIKTLEAAHYSYQLSQLWLVSGIALLTHFQRLKQERRVLDFTDLEWRAYQLLTQSQHAAWIQYKLDHRIQHLLIDEFQDTNPTQWHLLLPLLEELAAHHQTHKSVFVVGDHKQSIYGFRRADPHLFSIAQHWIESRLAGEVIESHQSFRSAPAIIELMNRLFMAPYAEIPGTEIPASWFHHHETHHVLRWGRVEIHPLCENPTPPADIIKNTHSPQLRNPLLTPRLVTLDQRYQQEALFIAQRIHALLISGLLIEDQGQSRPLRAGDIMILLRRRTHAAFYEQALQHASIPYVSVNRDTLLECQEINDIVALLEVLSTPFNNLALATVLRSPLFACSDTDLMQLSMTPGLYWKDRLDHLGKNSPPDTALQRAYLKINTWLNKAQQLPVHDLLDYIYHDGQVLARYAAVFPLHLQTRVRSNLTQFVDLALTMDSGRFSSLTRFLTHIKQLKLTQQDAPDPDLQEASNNSVKIFTIHGAKGLEAPVVFVADSAGQKTQDAGFQVMAHWPPDQTRPQYFYLAPRKEPDAFTAKNLEYLAEKTHLEDINLLYVALTRARQLLIITGVKPQKSNQWNWHQFICQRLGQDNNAINLPHIIESGQIFTKSNSQSLTVAPLTVTPRSNTDSSTPPLTAPTRKIPPIINPSSLHGNIISGAENSGPTPNDQRLRGLIIHRLLHELNEHRITEKVMAAQALSRHYGNLDIALFEQCWQEAQQLLEKPALARFFNPQYYLNAFNEMPAYQLQGDQLISGTIDRLVEYELEVCILDYKTQRITATEQMGLLADQVAAQLRAYRNIIERAWPQKKVSSFVIFTQSGTLVEID